MWKKGTDYFFLVQKSKGAKTLTEWHSPLGKYKNFKAVNGKYFLVYNHLFSNALGLVNSI